MGFQVAKQPLLPGIGGAVPELQPHLVTEEDPVCGGQGTHAGADCRFAAGSQGLDPRGGVDQEPGALAQASSRIRRSSAWVMKSGRLPNLSASFCRRRRRFSSTTAMTTASRLV